MNEIAKNEYIKSSFRDLMEAEMMLGYEKYGKVHNQFGALFKAFPEDQKRNVNYETELFRNFDITTAGFQKIQKYNWAKHRPLVACSVVFQVVMTNDLMIDDNYVIITVEDPLCTVYKILKEQPMLDNPDKMELVASPESSFIIGKLGPEPSLFRKVIDTGINVFETLS